MEFPILGFSYKWNLTVCGPCVWFRSFSILSSRINHVVAYIRTQFLFNLNISLHVLFIFSLIDGLLCCFHFFSSNEWWCYEHSCLNFCWSRYFQCLNIYFKVKLLGHMVETVANCFPKHLYYFTFTAAMSENSIFPRSLPMLALICLFDHSHIMNFYYD